MTVCLVHGMTQRSCPNRKHWENSKRSGKPACASTLTPRRSVLVYKTAGLQESISLMMSNKQEGFDEASLNSPTKDRSGVSWGGDETIRIPVVISLVMMTMCIYPNQWN